VVLDVDVARAEHLSIRRIEHVDVANHDRRRQSMPELGLELALQVLLSLVLRLREPIALAFPPGLEHAEIARVNEAEELLLRRAQPDERGLEIDTGERIQRHCTRLAAALQSQIRELLQRKLPAG